MKIQLAYGETGLDADIPDENVVKILRMQQCPVIDNPQRTLRHLLEQPTGSAPLSQLAQDKGDAVIVICDVTRPVPNAILLPPILENLQQAGIPKEHITILIATGLHRPNIGTELQSMVGEYIYKEFTILNHLWNDPEELINLGTTKRKTPVAINKHYINADLKITVGFIEPHIFAGFSGGRKMICPGLAGPQTVSRAHSPVFLEDPRCCEGHLSDNPLHQELLEIALMAGCDFSVNVALDELRHITGIFAGDMQQAHENGVEFVRKQAGDAVDQPVDIVVTSSGGYPLDTSFYQAVKGLTAALPIVKRGGTIIMAAECREGLGDAAFTDMVHQYPSVHSFMNKILNDDEVMMNQWQYEEACKVLRKCEVTVVTDGLADTDQSELPFIVLPSIQKAMQTAIEKHGSDSSIAVIPKGPYILAHTNTV